jgi:hypothetical protein
MPTSTTLRPHGGDALRAATCPLQNLRASRAPGASQEKHMSESHACAADGDPHADPGPCIPLRAMNARSAGAAPDAQQLRRIFLELRGRIRDPPGGVPAARRSRQLSITVDEEVYLVFQALCREHDLTVAMALQLLMSGRELPAARPQLLQLPAVVDAEALHVLHHLEDCIASSQADGAMVGGQASGEAGRLQALLADLRSTIGGKICPCSERERSAAPGSGRREDA